jgi:CRISPR-associated protein Csb2
MHKALTKLSDGHWVFSGREDDESISQRKERHTRFIPQFNRRGAITKMVLFAEAGFDQDAMQALTRFSMMPNQNDRNWFVTIESMTNELHGFKPSKRWVSITPLVLTRYTKRPCDNLESQLHLFCKRENLPRLIDIKPKQTEDHQDRILNRVPIHRPNQYGRVPSRKYWLELEFESEVDRPLTLGYNSHYGLGLFSATR